MSRMVTRAEWWNGNREQRGFLFRRDDLIIWWAWTHYHEVRERYARAQADPANGHLAIIRMRAPAASAELPPVIRSISITPEVSIHGVVPAGELKPALG